MSHTLHRFGPEETFQNDFPFISRPAMKINSDGAAPKMRRVIEIALDHEPVNWGSLTTKQNLTIGFDREDLLNKTEDNSPGMGCFDDREKVVAVLKQLKEEDLGMSVVVTGLRDKVEDICREAGLTPHSADLSLGIFGATELLPEDETLCFTTMCGHAMLSAGLVRNIRKAVREGRLTPEEGAKILAKPCYCGVFNQTRAAMLLEQEKEQQN
ncbi:MAG: hypothetical protein IJK77_01700 [Lachnospiraceae bacterium]|nr:hypothetical protein [Lachnospiraceae bacterium]MBQ7600695.1 hypothetical protein [Lachnospiraceae bacterium]